MNPIIKWLGGKTREIEMFEHCIPTYERYVEPFFGGGAVFFHLEPERAAINDASESLIEFYELIKKQDKRLCVLLIAYDNSINNIIYVCEQNADLLFKIFFQYKEGEIQINDLRILLLPIIEILSEKFTTDSAETLILNSDDFRTVMLDTAEDKFVRTAANFNKHPFSTDDLKENLITGFVGGFYMYFRKVYNDINLGKIAPPSVQYKAANFCFIREYCYGSMFRYNAKEEFNVPYGGKTYNRKNFHTKIENMFNEKTAKLFFNTDIHCSDFEKFINDIALTSDDFMFLDPPYDTEFSDYDGNSFSKLDQERLAYCLQKTPAKFMLVIKNTDFINKLYEKDFTVMKFDKQYTYNVLGRNSRNTEHLVITNYITQT